MRMVSALIGIILGASTFTLSYPTAHGADVTIDYSDSLDMKPALAAEIYAIKPILAVSSERNKDVKSLHIPEEALSGVIKMALHGNPELIEKYGGFENLADIGSALADGAITKEIKRFKETNHENSMNLVVSKSGSREMQIWNAASLISLLDNDMLNISTSDSSKIHQKNKEMNYATIKAEFVDPMEYIYTYAQTAAASPDSLTANREISAAMGFASAYLPNNALTERFGTITVGYPVVYTSEEMKMEVPESLSRKYDVYLIEIPITVSMNAYDYNIEEFFFGMQMPHDFVALELFPLRVSMEIDREERFGAPEFTIRGMDIGEFFGVTLRYKNIVPVLYASGLGTSAFSWTARDQAARVGSHRFVLILAAPKGVHRVELRISGHIRASNNAWITQREVAATVANQGVMVDLK